MMSLNRAHIITTTLAGMSLLLQVTVFMPFLVYATNQNEFSIGFLNIVGHGALAALCLLSIFVPCCLLLPHRFYTPGLSLLLSISLLFYAQSTFLVWDYGVLDGKDINWQEFSGHGRLDIVIWSFILTLSFFFSRQLERRGKTCAFLILFLSSTNIIPPLFNSLATGSTLRWFTPPQTALLTNLANFSKDQNIIHIVLDGFLSPSFENIINEDVQYRDYFSDFVYYRNTLASFPTTAPSIPTILSGQDYDGSVTLPSFYENTLRKHSLPSVLTAEGYDTHLATLSHYCQFLNVTGCASLAHYNASNSDKLALKELTTLLDVSLFRGLPQFMKVLIYNDQKWCFQQLFRKRKGPEIHVESLDFIESFPDAIRATAIKPTYKFIHLLIPHSPVRLNADCQSRSRKRRPTLEHYQAQARCALTLASKIIEELKNLDIYDKSMIIVSADHGFRTKFKHVEDQTKELPSISYALPLLLIKPFNHRGPLKTSEVPARLADLPATVQDALNLEAGFPEKSIFSLNPSDQRVRSFRYYRWKHRNWTGETLPPMKEYLIDGHAWNEQSWKYHRNLLPPSLSQ